jgi:hypothetical protein
MMQFGGKFESDMHVSLVTYPFNRRAAPEPPRASERIDKGVMGR